jgi:hypothetical protein
VLAGAVSGVAVAVVELDERPVVEAVALGAAPGRDALPGPSGHQGGQGVSPVEVAARGHPVVAGYRQDVAEPAGLERGRQLGVGAVRLVASHPASHDAGVQRTGEHETGHVVDPANTFV